MAGMVNTFTSMLPRSVAACKKRKSISEMLVALNEILVSCSHAMDGDGL